KKLPRRPRRPHLALLALIGYGTPVRSGDTVSNRDRLFDTVPMCVRFYSAISPEHKRFWSSLYEFMNFVLDFCRGTRRNNAVAVHASHERAVEAAADLSCRNAPVEQFGVAVDNVAVVVVVGTVVGIG